MPIGSAIGPCRIGNRSNLRRRGHSPVVARNDLAPVDRLPGQLCRGNPSGRRIPGAAAGGAGGAESLPVFSTVLAGLVVFFILENWVLWRHCHDPECPRDRVAGELILRGDAIHNFFDGIVIAASFLSAPALGVSSALAVVAHEVPQEVGDFAILLHSGYGKGRALGYNLLSSATTPVAAVIAYFALSALQPVVPYVLAISAASFLYIAMSDLVPSLHRVISVRKAAGQVAFIVAGILTMATIRTIAHG
ncbi:MAG: ZIP family metal transporter [Acidobacteriota bacterium]